MFAAHNITRLHHISMYLCVLLSFAVVATTTTGPVLNAVFLLSMPVSWVLHQREWTQALPALLWNILIFGLIAISGFLLYTTDESIISAGVRFITLLLLLKLYARKGARDDWQIYALSFLLMSAGTAVNEDVVYGLIFGVYVLVGTFGLSFLHLYQEVGLTTRRWNTQNLARIYASALTLLAGFVFVSSVIIFFVFPRVGLGLFAAKTREASNMTGFSDQVQLGGHGLIRDNPTVAIRAETPDNMPPKGFETFHWRVMSFDSYDGAKWSREENPQTRAPTFDREDQSYSFEKVHPPALLTQLKSSSETRTLQMYVEPLGTQEIPVLSHLHTLRMGSKEIKIPFNPNKGRLRYSENGDVRYNRRSQIGVQYAMTWWEPPHSNAFASANEPVPQEILAQYTQLPEGLERMSALAGQLTQGMTTPHAKATRILQHLEANYAYTTNLPPVDNDNPIESFLFDTKRGHCEFYASSMTLMLRSQGVPARLVNGFLGGAWYGDYLAVRQGDAHSWVEVYVAPYGWVPYDPTPSVGTLPPKLPPLQQWFNEQLDGAKFAWNKWVLEYDLGAQFSLLKDLAKTLSPRGSFSSSSDSTQEKSSDKQSLPTRLIFYLLGSTACCVLSWTTTGALKRRSRIVQTIAVVVWASAGAAWQLWFLDPSTMSWVLGGAGPVCASLVALVFSREHAGSQEAQSHALFLQLETLARRHLNIKRAQDEGPQAFIQRLSAHAPQAHDDLQRFARRYLRARFGQDPLTPQEQRAMRAMFKRLSKLFKQRLE